MNSKLIKRFMLKLQFCLVLNGLIFVNCKEFTDNDRILRIVENFSSRSYRKNLTDNLHDQFNHRAEYLKDEERPLIRRFLNKLRSTVTNTYDQYTTNYLFNDHHTRNINHFDPTWNSNNRFPNRFDNHNPFNKYVQDSYNSNYNNNFNKRPTSASGYSSGYTFSLNSTPPTNVSTINRPIHKPLIRPIYKPNVGTNPRPTYPSNHHRPSSTNRYIVKSKYNSDCACKRRINGVYNSYVPTTSIFTTYNPTTNSVSTTPTSTPQSSFREIRSRNNLNNSNLLKKNEKDLNTRIVNGTMADYFRFPWMVSLGKAIDDKYTNGSHYCGGTLISPYWVMSAGHCVDDFKPKKLLIAYGSGDRSKMKNVIEASRFVVHPQYSGWPHYQNDIALIKLKKPVYLDGSIRPACLYSDSSIKYGKEFDAIGWGKTGDNDEFPTQLQKTRLAYIDTKECNQRWSKELDHPDITNNSLCVYKERTDICAGDSGSPLMNLAEDGTQYVTGVASFTNFCDQSQPAVYVSVFPYIDWIISVVKSFC